MKNVFRNRDFLNPMVVKELRQGLQSRGYLSAFLGLQGLMVLSMVIYLSEAGTPGSGFGFANGFFWTMAGLVMVVGMPMRGFQAIHQEIKGNTLEMVFLTRMTSWRISFGKWMALVIQTLLLLASIFPYLVLRYFMGSINLFQDLQTIFYLLTASMLLSAIGVGISGWQSRLLRGLLAAGMVFLVLSLPQFLMFLAFTGSVGAGGTGFRFGLLEFFMLVWLAVWLMLFFVSYGASVIAPVAENHSRHKRGIGLVVLLSLLLYSNLTGHAWVWVLSFVLVVPLLVDALCEPVKLIPSLYTPQRWMPAGIRWLFFPGWVTALFFTLLCMAILYAGTVYPGGMQDSIWIMMNLYSILVLPVALVLNLFPRVGKWIPAYMAFQLGAFITSVVLIAIHEITFRDWMDSFMRWVPHLAFFYLFDDANRADSETAVAVTAVFFLVTLGAMAAARKPFRMMLNLCRETRDMPGPDAV